MFVHGDIVVVSMHAHAATSHKPKQTHKTLQNRSWLVAASWGAAAAFRS
jgi:hypothetical protein